MLVQGHAQMNTVRLETRRWALRVRHHRMGRPPPARGSRVGEVSGSSIHPGQAGPHFAPSHLWTEKLEKTQSQGVAFKKALKAKETGPVPRAKVTRGQRSLLLQETAQAEEKSVLWEAGQAQPRPPAWSPGSSSQALTAGRGTGPIVSVQGTELQVTVLRGTLLSPQHPGVGGDLVQGGPLGGPQ